MSLIALLDGNTLWGRHFARAWKLPNGTDYLKIRWGSVGHNPQDRTMHAYKSCAPEHLLTLQRRLFPACTPINLQTNEAAAHERLELKEARPEWSDTLKRIADCNPYSALYRSGPSLCRQRSAHHSSSRQSPRLALASRARGPRSPALVPLHERRFSESQAIDTPLTRISRGTSKVRRWMMPCSQRPSSPQQSP